MKRRGFLSFLFIAPFAKAVAKVVPKSRPYNYMVFLRPPAASIAQYSWNEAHASVTITWEELKKDGVTVTDFKKYVLA